MLSVKNVTGSEQVWGGLIFADNEERVVLAADRTALANDIPFYMCVLSESALVYADGTHISDAVVACEAIRMEMKKDEEGILLTRGKYAPDNYYHSSRTVRFTTNDVSSLDQEWWPGSTSTECSISLHKLEDGEIVSATTLTATLTKIVWNPVDKMIPRKIVINSASSDVKSWVGFEGMENYDEGRLYCNSHMIDRKVEIDVSEPRLSPASLVFYVGHSILQATDIEITIEYFTNYEND